MHIFFSRTVEEAFKSLTLLKAEKQQCINIFCYKHSTFYSSNSTEVLAAKALIMQNSPFQSDYCITLDDEFMRRQHFNVVAAHNGDNFGYFVVIFLSSSYSCL